ncbi:MAG: hypothetical protein FJX75_13090 [Armatimonadetes bacterium]|nr:hypothetical protein [Armatimonadota bacterium]
MIAQVVLVLSVLGGNAMAADVPTFYVSTAGKDAWSGKLPDPNADGTDGPLATLAAARDAARKLGPDQPKRIVIREGEYYLDEPLTLGPEDSNLTIEAFSLDWVSGGRKIAGSPEPVTLYGGRLVTGWKPDGDRFWSAELPEVAAGTWDFRMLVVNGRFCKRARLPAQGYLAHLTDFQVPWMSTTGGGWQRKPTEDELTTMQYRPEDLGPWLDLKNAEITVYHMWDESVVGVKSLDPATQIIRFANPAGHPPGAFGVHNYVVWNVREGMTEPGQWYLDRTAGKVVYWPLPGENMTQARAIAPKAFSVIRIAGTKENPARNIRIANLALSVTNTPLKAGGFGASSFDGAVHASQTEGCGIEGLTIHNVGGQAIRADQSKGLTVRNCEVYDTGACGIMARSEGAVVEQNVVHNIGVTYPSAIAVWGGAKGNVIRHNTIHDCPYTAICCEGEDHLIESNLIHHAMQELKDGAGIYITFCKRITLRGNFIRDIAEVGGYGSSAYYLDEQAEDCVVEGNLSLRVPRPSHNHMAKNNTIRNNVFVCEENAVLTFPKCEGFTFEKNVIVAPGKVTFSNPVAITQGSSNLIQTGAIEGEPLGMVPGDPLLTGLEEGKLGFGDGSPAPGLGIVPIDVSGAGRSDKELADIDLIQGNAVVDF